MVKSKRLAGSEYVAVTPEGYISLYQFVGQTEFIIGNVYGNEFIIAHGYKEKNVFTKKSHGLLGEILLQRWLSCE